MAEQSNNHQLAEAANYVASQMGLTLCNPGPEYGSLLRQLVSINNVPDHFIRFASFCEGYPQQALTGGDGNKSLILYNTASSLTINDSMESIYAADCSRVLAITWGFPTDTGILEIIDVEKSITLQKLSGVSQGQGGAVIIAHAYAPHQQPYKGVAQFRREDIPKLQKTIEILLQK